MKDQIKQAFEKVTGRDLDDYEWDLLLEGDDLGMDGLDFVEFIMSLESQLQISIPDDTAESLSTPNQWLAYLNSVSKVAILKESTPSTEQESQEGLWEKLFTMLYDECEMNANIFSTEQMIDKLKPYFTITRKP